MRRTSLFLALLLVSAVALSHGQPPKKDDKDYSAELPRIKPKEPAEALATFKLRPGFRIELVAAEPLIRSPVAMDFDEDGRLFVVEFPEYNQYANKDFKGHGCVKLLEDIDDNGRYRKSSVYVDNLNSPVAVACWDGGVFVGVVPDILYCKGDVRKPVFTGFSRDIAGEAMLNSFRWSLENRFHVSTSLAGGNVRGADRPNQRPASVRQQGFVFDPRSGDFEITSGGGQHGMSLDDWGRKFVCENSNPIHLVMYDGRYLARNTSVTAPAAAVNIAPEGKFTKLMRISPNEPWRVLRTRLRTQGVVPGSDEGGQPSGFFTGATGVTVYRGDAWPEEYRGSVFVGEVANNLVYRAKLEPNGVGLTAKRADSEQEFLASTDNWFRPVQFANGPDGCLYVIDMYRELIEGAAFLPPQILKHMDVASGMDRGRIYRIVPEGFKRRPMPKLSQATTAELVALLEHPNAWHRDTASRLLYQRQDRAAIAPLKTLSAESKSPLGRVHALYALAGLGALDAAATLRALTDPEPHVREHGLRLAERLRDLQAIRERLERMTDDADLRVRYQLAFSLGAIEGPMPTRALVKLAQRDGGDVWFRLAIQTSSADRAGDLFSALVADRTYRATVHGRALLNALATQIGGTNRSNDVAAVVKAIDELPEGEKALSHELVRSLITRQSAKTRETLSGADGGKAGAIVAVMLRDARTIAADAKKTPGDRAAAVRTLGLAPFGENKELFADLLGPKQPQPVQAAALETLARFDRPEVAALVLDVWPTLSPALRATAAETLFARPAWVGAFLDAVEKGHVKPADIDPARIDVLQASADERVRARAKKLFAGAKLSKRQDVVAAYQKALDLKGDAAKGKLVFKNHCSTCHRLEGVGEAIGADLMAIRDHGKEAVMLNILDPNREVKPQYLSYVVRLDSGRTVTGMITAETATSLTVRRLDNVSETFLRANVEDLRSTGLSFMPEGLEKQIDHQAMADLLAYLNSIK
jgi:putative membrane-bound dehydrogenase-like protein